MKDTDNLSEMANVGDRQDMEDNMNFLTQQQGAHTISTGVSTPNMDSDAAQCTTVAYQANILENRINKIRREFTVEEIEGFKQLGMEAL